MKCSIRCLSVLVCLVLSLAAFSVTANAEEIEVAPYHVYLNTSFFTNVESNSSWITLSFKPGDGITNAVTKADNIIRTHWTISNEYYFTTDDNSFFVSEGNTVNVTIENMMESLGIYDGVHDKVVTTPKTASGYARYTDGSIEYVNIEIVPRTSGRYDLKFSLSAKKDVQQFCVTTNYIVTQMFDYFSNTKCQYSYTVGEINGFDEGYNFRVNIEDPNTGLLSGIWDSLTSGFKALGDKISSLWTAITELPAKIWGFIENGLKSLFVPDEEYMVGYKSRWEDELSEKLGAVWQVTDILLTSWERITLADEQDTIEMPEVVIPLPEGNEFAFGGYDVKIVPEGFEFLADACKMALGILCTWLFIGGLRKRYDEVMGVEQ